MAAARKWTYSEVEGFRMWDQNRKDGKLGSPVNFKDVKSLESWLHERT